MFPNQKIELDGHPVFRRTVLVWSLYFLLGLFSFSMCILGPAIPFLRQEFRMGYTLASLHMTLYAIGMVLAGISAAPIQRRIGTIGGIWTGMGGILTGATLLVLAPGVWMSLPAILVMSFFGTLALAGIPTTLAALFPQARTKAIMESNVVASVGSAVPPFLIALGAFTPLGWRIVTPAFALGLAAVACFGWTATRRHGRSETAQTPDAPGRLPWAYWVCWLIIIFGIGVEWCVAFWSAEYLKGLPGGSLSLAAAGAGVYQLAAVGCRFTSSRLATRMSAPQILLGGIFLVSAGFPLFWLRAGVASAFLGVALCGAGASLFYPTNIALAMVASNHRIRQANAYVPVASGIALALAPLTLGRIADQVGLGSALLMIPVFLAAMGLLLVVRKAGSAQTKHLSTR